MEVHARYDERLDVAVARVDMADLNNNKSVVQLCS
jgi:hypothetical protein